MGVPVSDAVRMATIGPARFLGIQDETGSIRCGKKADLIFVDENFVCKKTYVDGTLVYDASTPQEQLFNPEAMKRKVQ